jgi:ferrochelatase
MSEGGKKAILMLAFGGADSIDNVEPFIKNVLAPREPSPELIADVRERYKTIGGFSPITNTTMEQAAALESLISLLLSKDVRVYVGMKNWNPSIKDAVAEMKADGVTDCVAVIMAPHTSKAATGGYNKAVAEAVEAAGGGINVEYAKDWHTHWKYIDIVIETMMTAYAHFISLRYKEKVMTIFSAHSLPKNILEGDDYVKKIEETLELVNSRMQIENRLAYQSKGGGGGGVEWIGPTVEEAMDEAKELGKIGVMVVPISFVTENVETLFDVDVLFKEKARSLGLSFSRAPAMNAERKFLEAIIESIEDKL